MISGHTAQLVILVVGVAILLVAVGIAIAAEVQSRRERCRRRAALHQWVEYTFSQCVPDIRSDAEHQAWLDKHGGQPPRIPPIPS